MAKKFKALRDKMSPESRNRVEEKVARELEKMNLQDLRKALSLTQKQLAETLDLNQAAISKMEHQTDMYISTLKRFVEAMGGTIEIRAKFPGKEITIDQFHVENEYITDDDITKEFLLGNSDSEEEFAA